MRFTSKPILVVIGPSGAGKSTILRKLVNAGMLEVHPTWTTRTPRPNELEEGLEHIFVDQATFIAKQQSGFFLETVQMFGLPFSYGLPRIKPVQTDRVQAVMMRATLLDLFAKHFDNYIIYQFEDDIERVKQRLEARVAAGEPLGTRLSDYTNEVALGRRLAKRLFKNDQNIDVFVDQVKTALLEDFEQ